MKGIIFILTIVSFEFANSASNKLGPDFQDEDHTTCKEFSKYARFNPYSVLDDVWVVFYYWGVVKPLYIYKFKVPTTRQRTILQKYLNETKVTYPVNWTQPVIIMKDVLHNDSHLIVQMGDRGEFLKYPVVRKMKKGAIIYPQLINFKQINNGTYLAYMTCLTQEAYVLSKPRDVPSKAKMKDVVANVGFRSRKGKSYLYQGDEWMPIPEADDYKPGMFYHMIDNYYN